MACGLSEPELLGVERWLSVELLCLYIDPHTCYVTCGELFVLSAGNLG